MVRRFPTLSSTGGLLLAALAGYGAWSSIGLAARWGVSLGGVLLLAGWLTTAVLAVPLGRGRPSAALTAVLLLIAAAWRIGSAACFAHRVPAGDALSYLTLSDGLMSGEGLRIYEPYIGSTLLAFYPPVYPLLLAGWRIVAGGSTLSLVVLNLVVDATAAILLYRLATMLGRREAGRSAAWLYLIWPSVLLSAPLAQKEGLCALLVIALAIAWWRAIQAPGWRTAGLVGAIAGVLALTQPGLAPLGVLFGAILVPLASVRRIAGVGWRAAPFAIAALLPWWLRNWAALGAFVPLTTAGAISLWVGNNPDATGNWLPTPVALRGLPELGYARAAGALAREWIAANPAAFLRLSLTKFVRACGIGQFGVVRLAAMSPGPTPGLTALLFPVAQASHLLLLGTSASALFARARRVPTALLLLAAACGLQLVLFGVWFEFGERHREFATPFLLLLIAEAFVRPPSADAEIGGTEGVRQ